MSVFYILSRGKVREWLSRKWARETVGVIEGEGAREENKQGYVSSLTQVRIREKRRKR